MVGFPWIIGPQLLLENVNKSFKRLIKQSKDVTLNIENDVFIRHNVTTCTMRNLYKDVSLNTIHAFGLDIIHKNLNSNFSYHEMETQ